MASGWRATDRQALQLTVIDVSAVEDRPSTLELKASRRRAA